MINKNEVDLNISEYRVLSTDYIFEHEYLAENL